MRVRAAGASVTGHVRSSNQDRFVVDAESGVFIVADGMGGHAAGDVASDIAVRETHAEWLSPVVREAVRDYAASQEREERQRLWAAVRRGTERAHQGILDHASVHPEAVGMGTTLTGFVIADDEVVFTHCGDSRAYLVRDGMAMQLSQDHTLEETMRAIGRGSAAPRGGGGLTQALGVGDPRAAVFLVPVFPGDHLVLCTDGIHQYVDESEIGGVVTEHDDAEGIVAHLVEISLERGGADNATAVVVCIDATSAPDRPKRRHQLDDLALAKCPLLSELTPAERLRATRMTTIRELDPGEHIPAVAMGEPAAYIILDGEAKGPVGSLGCGDVVYPSSLVPGAPTLPRHALAVTQQRCRLLTLRRDDFIEIAEEDGPLGVTLYAALARLQ